MLMVNIKDTCLVDYDITTIAQRMYNIYIYMCMLCLADIIVAQRMYSIYIYMCMLCLADITVAQRMYNIYIYMCMTLCLADITIAQRVTKSYDLTTNTLDDWLEPCPTSDNDVG